MSTAAGSDEEGLVDRMVVEKPITRRSVRVPATREQASGGQWENTRPLQRKRHAPADPRPRPLLERQLRVDSLKTLLESVSRLWRDLLVLETRRRRRPRKGGEVSDRVDVALRMDSELDDTVGSRLKKRKTERGSSAKGLRVRIWERGNAPGRCKNRCRPCESPAGG